MKKGWIPMLFLTFLFARAAAPFNGHVAQEGPLALTIDKIEDVTECETPRDVEVSVKNAGEASLAVKLEMKDLVDEWRAAGPSRQTLQVAPGAEAAATFQIVASQGACSALYPVHIYATFRDAGRETAVHAVQVFQSRFGAKPQAPQGQAEMKANVVPAQGALTLAPLRTQRVAWARFGGPPVYMPVGWEGSEPESKATFTRVRVARGEEKEAIQMHPPYRNGAGTIFAEYLLQLPQTRPIRLLFSNAIRDNGPKEPPSDGVTFRVWANDEKLFDRHTDSKTWVEGEADLSRFAGRQILLRLESHPGPKRNTVCDTSYWGEPTVVAGSLPAQLTAAEKQKLAQRARAAVAAPKGADKGAFVFELENSTVAAAVLGPNGLADAALAFGTGERCVVFDGLKVSVLRHEVGRWPSQIAVRKVEAAKDASGRLRVVHRLALGDEEFDWTAEAWAEGCGLRIHLACPKYITDIAAGPADQKAPRVYYGHGYCVVEPKAFKAGAGGHNLSTSHVGFDFERGVSLLMACDTPPDNLEVDPDRRTYALHTHPDATLTFVPSLRGAFQCAIDYRPLYDKQPAGGVRRKAGRFVFDIWGGRYADIAQSTKRLFAYGLTDSMLIIHSWQRWGYDYRLPDIYPPNPQFGSPEDLREVGRICAAQDVPWGLHDNYIDFYPDATGYSYNHICFTEQGAPIKAWINVGREAQSYRWRPDRFMPFLQRNLEQIKANLAPTAYFIDEVGRRGQVRYGLLHRRLRLVEFRRFLRPRGESAFEARNAPLLGRGLRLDPRLSGRRGAHGVRGGGRPSDRLSGWGGLPAPATVALPGFPSLGGALPGLGARALVRRRQPRPVHSARRGLLGALRRPAATLRARHRKRRLHFG